MHYVLQIQIFITGLQTHAGDEERRPNYSDRSEVGSRLPIYYLLHLTQFYKPEL